MLHIPLWERPTRSLFMYLTNKRTLIGLTLTRGATSLYHGVPESVVAAFLSAPLKRSVLQSIHTRSLSIGSKRQ